MVARVVRVEGRLMLELDSTAQESLSAFEGGEVELRVGAGEVIVAAAASSDFDRLAREILVRHATTFEKLSK